jgi:ankyrin repeat protein
LRAAKQDQVDVLRLLLQRTRPAPDSHESVVLLDAAAHRGRLAMVEMLLANGVQPRGGFGLLGAIIGYQQDPAERVEIVKLMLAAGEDSRTDGALIAAVKEGAAEIVRLLLDAGASPNGQRPDDDPPLYFAATDSVLRMLVAAGADPNRIVRGTTPLDRVVGEGRIASVGALLAAGARPDVGRSSLLTAVKYDIEPEIVRLLVAAGADPFARAEPYGKNPGGTIVEITTRHLALESLQTLLAVPAVAASIRGDSGASVLEIAASAGAASEPEPRVLAVVQCLLTAGAGPNLTQAARHSPALVTASVYGQPTVVRALLAAGALVNGRDNFCHTPLGYLSQNTVVVGRNTEVVRILLEAGADPNLRIPRSYDCKDKSSYATPLFWIADQPQTMYLEVEQAKTDIVRLLIAAKADRNARGPEGKTPAQAADSHGESDTAELLRKPSGR